MKTIIAFNLNPDLKLNAIRNTQTSVKARTSIYDLLYLNLPKLNFRLGIKKNGSWFTGFLLI